MRNLNICIEDICLSFTYGPVDVMFYVLIPHLGLGLKHLGRREVPEALNVRFRYGVQMDN